MAAVQRSPAGKRSQHIEFVDLKFQYAALKESVHAARYQQPTYAEICRGGSLPVGEKLAGEVISLPMHPYLYEATQDQMVAVVRAFSNNSGATNY